MSCVCGVLAGRRGGRAGRTAGMGGRGGAERGRESRDAPGEDRVVVEAEDVEEGVDCALR